jgi:ABC-type nitrate/sulfonate/bicarbonate transport system permease component
MKRVAKAVAMEVWLPVVLVAALWFGTARSTDFYYPPLKVVLRAFQHQWLFGRLRSDALPSVANFLGGLLIAVVVGVVLGLLLGLADPLYDAVRPVLEFMRAIPGIVLVPVGLVVLGTGDSMKAVIIAYGTLWPILLSTVDGVRSIDPVILDMARSYRLPLRQRIRRVVLPGAAPQILAGVRVSVALGVVLIIASEYVASTHGIGYAQLQAERTFAIPEMWAALLLLGILGYVSNLAFHLIELRLLRWYTGLRKAGRGDSAS